MWTRHKEFCAAPDFQRLRAERNATVLKLFREQVTELGGDPDQVQLHYNFNACYCACSSNGPCEHKWDGPEYEGESFGSVTCSKCGTLAMSHDLAVLP